MQNATTLDDDYHALIDFNGWLCSDGSRCWFWKGGQSEGTQQRAQREAWLWAGRFRPGSSQVIRAVCNYDRCMNPDHLEATCAILGKPLPEGAPHVLRDQPPEARALAKLDAGTWRKERGINFIVPAWRSK